MAERSTSLTRAIDILTALGSPDVTSGGGVGVVEISRIVGREKSQVSRTLKSLTEAGFVLRDPDTRRYRLGWRLFTLAANASDQRLIALAPHVLRRLVARVREGVHLSVLEGGEVVTLMSESAGRAIQAVPWVGRGTPLYCTSAGRALLFDHTDDEVRALLDGVELTGAGPKAPRDVDDVLTRLHEARALGYAGIDEEFEVGHTAVAAPVRDFGGRIVAALNISIPKYRLGRSLRPAGREVSNAADSLTRALSPTPHERRLP
ncbi:MAG TPA: IclR family transcriptional regulator [Streptosporangiales bacterium]